MFWKTLGAGVLALGLAACGPQARASLTPVEGDAFLGPADAKVTVIEFAAPTCPVCKAWHDKFWGEMKSAYIDSGKIRFVLRELPSHNPPVDAAVFAIARCAGPADYFPVIDKAFERQEAIEIASRSADGPRKALVSLGQEFRLSEAQVEACIKDPKNVQRIYDVQADADARGVTGTPTFFVNDRLIGGATMEEVWTQTRTALEAALAPPAPAAPAATPPAAPPATPPAPGGN
jgi:protein-disulfide isomerase